MRPCRGRNVGRPPATQPRSAPEHSGRLGVLPAKCRAAALAYRWALHAAGHRQPRVPVVQSDRTSASGAEGCRFESCRGYYVRTRWLHGQLGVWASTDSIGYEDSLNLFLYVHSQPTGFVDPYGEEAEKKDCCCCCAKSVVINDGGLKDHPMGGKYYAVDVDLNTVWKPSVTFQDCELEWWERSNQRLGSVDPKTGKQRLGPGTWWNMYKEEHASPTFAKWRDKGEIKTCDAAGTDLKITINDTPSTTAPGGKLTLNIWFAIILRSAKDCPCDEPRDAEAYALLNIEIDKFMLKKAKLNIGQWKTPPPYPKGLPLRPDKPAK
jgi:RHS repeat-associated protein